MQVTIKTAAELDAIFASPTSYWTTTIGKRLKNDTAPRRNKVRSLSVCEGLVVSLLCM